MERNDEIDIEISNNEKKLIIKFAYPDSIENVVREREFVVDNKSILDYLIDLNEFDYATEAMIIKMMNHIVNKHGGIKNEGINLRNHDSFNKIYNSIQYLRDTLYSIFQYYSQSRISSIKEICLSKNSLFVEDTKYENSSFAFEEDNEYYTVNITETRKICDMFLNYYKGEYYYEN